MTPTDRVLALRPGRWLGVSARRRARQVQVIALAVFAFVSLLVLSGALDGIDRGLVAGIRASQRWVDPVGLWVELPGLRSFLYPAVLVFVLAVSLRRRDLRPVLSAAVTFFLVNVVAGGIKLATARATPRIGGPETFAERMSGLVGAFPSGHAANIAAVAVLLTILGRRYGSRRAAVAAAVLGAGATLAVSVTSWLRDTHWTSDLVAGVACGAAVAATAVLVVDRVGPMWPHASARVPRPVLWAVAVAVLVALGAGWVLDTSWSPDHLGWLALGLGTGVVGWLLSDFRQERRMKREARSTVDAIEHDLAPLARRTR